MALRSLSLSASAVALALLLAACGGSDASDTTPMRAGRDVYGSICSACHGPVGQGGVGPALDEVLETFPACEDHIEWVTLGSDRWREQGRDTYGATDKPIKGGMPENGATLTEEEISAAVFYERVRFGDVEEAAAMRNCGLSSAGG